MAAALSAPTTVEGEQRRAAAGCPHRVAFPLMDQDWVDLSFLHWRYDAERVRQLLPAGVTLDTFDGDAWVGIVPFLLRVRVPRGPVLPWVGVFPETNVRTYVRGPDGHAGIWFLSLDAPRRLAMWAARRMYSLPYHAAATRMRCDGPTRDYASWRTSGQHRGASSRARVSVGERIAESDVTPLEHFLTARWRLYAAVPGGIATARVEHEPWILKRATATGVDARLVVAAGLPLPTGEPVVHAADDVHAAMSRLVRCRASGGHANG
jgi:uncharacterized protein YqjF (DUF2071 family)